MTNLLGRQTNSKCSHCGQLIYINDNDEWWCNCGNSNDEELTQFITVMNRYAELKRYKKFQQALGCASLLLTVSILLVVFWMVVR